jgi:L-rhamnose mutarotase
MSVRPTTTIGRRTTLRAGQELTYDEVHAHIPDAVERALRRSGVVRWHIWRDGRLLFHSIETIDGYEAMVRAIGLPGPVDAPWDAIIAALLEPEEVSDVVLPLIWKLDEVGQGNGAES